MRSEGLAGNSSLRALDISLKCQGRSLPAPSEARQAGKLRDYLTEIARRLLRLPSATSQRRVAPVIVIGQPPNGFTLIELMVVVVIMAILATMAVPSFNKSMENARKKEAETTLELIYSAQKIYRLDRNPKCYATNFAGVFLNYIDTPRSDYYDFRVDSPNAITFTATATRKGSGTQLTIDQDGNKTGW